LTACVEMFSLINRRQELIEHDSAAVRASLAQIKNTSASIERSDHRWEVLQTLEGLDPELDALLGFAPIAACQAILLLERLAHQLGVSESGLAHSGDLSW